MNPTTVQAIHDRLRTIYRAVTGTPMVEPEAAPDEAAVSLEDVARRFADLEAMTVANPAITERVPPFSFFPPVDVLEGVDELIVEVAAPGIRKDELSVEVSGDTLVVSGVRPGKGGLDSRAYVHAEIPRGPFSRSVKLPYEIQAQPRVEVERGIVSIRLARKPAPQEGAGKSS